MKDLGVPAEFTTYIDFVYPTLGVPDSKKVIQNVMDCGQFQQTAVDALFVYYCNLGKIDLAFDLSKIIFISKYIFFLLQSSCRNLLQALLKFIILLLFIYLFNFCSSE